MTFLNLQNVFIKVTKRLSRDLLKLVTVESNERFQAELGNFYRNEFLEIDEEQEMLTSYVEENEMKH